MNYYKLKSKTGITFIEVMLSLAIFSGGIVAVLKTYNISIDRINHLTNRLYVTTLLDNRVFEVNRTLRVYNALPFDLNHSVVIDVGGKELTFSQEMSLSEIEDFADIFQMDLAFTWMEGDQKKRLSRSSYIGRFGSDPKT